jgi:hypothetical protein
LAGLPTTPPPTSFRNGTEVWRSAADPNVVSARCGRGFGSWASRVIQLTPVLSCTAGRALLQHVPACPAGLARPVSVAIATAPASAQIMTVHEMASRAFLFNGLMLCSSQGMTAQATRLTYRSVPTTLARVDYSVFAPV